jgi:hypothetical protein
MVQLRLTKPAIARVLCYLWVALLAFSFFVTLRYTRHTALRTEEFAYACDQFGYLRMAQQIRHAFAEKEWPEFKLESKQTRTLVNFLQDKHVPTEKMEEVVAPHAHHYFPESGYVGVQYPPGTGLALAMFPEGEALYGLNRLVVFVFAVLGTAALLIAAWKRAWRSVGLLVLAFCLGLLILERIGTLSFSINAVLVPILLTCVLSFVALWINHNRHDRLALVCAFAAGASLGFATLVRLPSILLLPGFFVLFWPGLRHLFQLKSLALAFVLGTVLVGVVPVLINQSEVAGAWYLPTYSRIDASAPTLERLRFNLSFYLGHGPATLDNWALLCAAAGFAGFLILYVKGDTTASNRFGLTWKRLAVAGAIMWLVPLLYFLSHRIAVLHYMIPSVFATVALLGMGSFCLELDSEGRLHPRRIVSLAALLLILLPGVVVLKRAWPLRSRSPGPMMAVTQSPILLPPELVDDQAWVWADLLTGSLWYYAKKPAFKIEFTDKDTRAMIFQFIRERGERQYIVQDSELMKQYMDEITQLGGKLELHGVIHHAPYYLVVWPGEGSR